MHNFEDISIFRRLRSLGYGEFLLLLGFGALAIPTLVNLARLSWSTEAGAHGPIVLATAIWLIWREKDRFKLGRRQPLFPAAAALLLILPIYIIGRVTSILMFESLALYGITVIILYLNYGGKVLRSLWFPLVYLLFLITPPENWIFVATRPLKMVLSQVAVTLLAACGMSVGSSGNMIQVDGYQLLVASACSGLNSMIGITAIGLFYVYLRHGSEARYSTLLMLLLIPVAVLTNLLRIIGLVIATDFFGPGVVDGIVHDAAGIGTFAIALALLLLIDAGMFPIFKRLARERAW